MTIQEFIANAKKQSEERKLRAQQFLAKLQERAKEVSKK